MLCHRNELNHGHMHVKPDQRETIERLRRKQGIRA